LNFDFSFLVLGMYNRCVQAEETER